MAQIDDFAASSLVRQAPRGIFNLDLPGVMRGKVGPSPAMARRHLPSTSHP